MRNFTALLLTLLLAPVFTLAEIAHLRGGGDEREWSSFPKQAAGDAHTFTFQHDGEEVAELWLGQEDVKARWEIELNGKRLGYLNVEEDKCRIAYPIKASQLEQGENTLRVFHQSGRDVDDIRVGPLELRTESEQRSTLLVHVTEKTKPVPCRITIVDEAGFLVPMAISSNDRLAVREGVVYTIDGRAEIPLPPGTYTIYAGRGFEYSLAQQSVTITDQAINLALSIERQVDTAGLVSCDTHVHTYTYSKHGDCTLTERMITLAGENVELAIATDHNKHVDYQAEMDRLDIKHFTAVTGNEYTTRTGHFNLFPLDAKAKPPTYIGPDWAKVMDSVKQSGATISILNHAQDVHTNWRPFDPENHDRVAGKSRKGYAYTFNAMELLNSGATLNDPMMLYRDWFGLLNAGLNIAGIGSSDSHDVSNFIVGQGRTYIPISDENVSEIDVTAACEQLLAGNGMVSYGLLTQMSIADGQATVSIQAPSWSKADRLQIFANGQAIMDERFTPTSTFNKTFALPKATGRTFYVAVARGPGIIGLYWPAAKPYQRRGADFVPYVLGSSAVIWVD